MRILLASAEANNSQPIDNLFHDSNKMIKVSVPIKSIRSNFCPSAKTSFEAFL